MDDDKDMENDPDYAPSRKRLRKAEVESCLDPLVKKNRWYVKTHVIF